MGPKRQRYFHMKQFLMSRTNTKAYSGFKGHQHSGLTGITGNCHTFYMWCQDKRKDSESQVDTIVTLHKAYMMFKQTFHSDCGWRSIRRSSLYFTRTCVLHEVQVHQNLSWTLIWRKIELGNWGYHCTKQRVGNLKEANRASSETKERIDRVAKRNVQDRKEKVKIDHKLEGHFIKFLHMMPRSESMWNKRLHRLSVAEHCIKWTIKPNLTGTLRYIQSTAKGTSG